jgi:hypothetical protein
MGFWEMSFIYFEPGGFFVELDPYCLTSGLFF